MSIAERRLRLLAGLVGGFIVLQLLARGTPPKCIRILDIRQSERIDMATDIVRDVDFIQTDITSASSVNAAFAKPWDKTTTRLPLTVFHTAAVILVSDRSNYMFAFPEAVNIRGTQNVLDAAKTAGADIFSSTSSASISILPVQSFVRPWAKEPHNFWQILDERDFFRPLRPHDEYFGNYAATKAKAERLVCSANSEAFRTGCIRPANGVYGNPTDNTVGGPLSRSVFPTYVQVPMIIVFVVANTCWVDGFHILSRALYMERTSQLHTFTTKLFSSMRITRRKPEDHLWSPIPIPLFLTETFIPQYPLCRAIPF